MIYTSPGQQTFSSLNFLDPIRALLNFNILPSNGELELVKKGEDGSLLAEAEFEILDSTGKVVATQKTNSKGVLLVEDLAEGTYTIREKTAPKGYIISSETVQAIIKDGQKSIVEFINALAQGRLEIVKEDHETNVRLEGAIFDVVDSLGNVVDTVTTDKNGTAFTKLLALGHYKLIEKTAPKGYQLESTPVDFELAYQDQNTSIVNLVLTLLNADLPPSIGTSATNNEDGSKVLDALEEVVIKDSVSYTDLIVGKWYEIVGHLRDKVTGNKLLVDGKEVTSSIKFQAEKTSGVIDLLFKLNASALQGKEVVVFEDLFRNGVLVASHADINDKGQTVKFTNPKLGTTATNNEDGGKVLDALEEVVIKDSVSYSDLIVDKWYEIVGHLRDKTTGNKLLIDGKEITSKVKFQAEKTSGLIDLLFTLNASALQGKEVVVFEDLYREGSLLTSHANINDKGQTVRFTKPKLQTEAKYEDGLKETNPLEKVTIIDTVSYQDLIIGKKYTVEGILMDKATNKPLLVDGKEIRSTLTFTATQANGTVEIKFDIPAYLLRGKEIVVFEDLIREGQELAFHRDIEDEKQTVIVNDPKIGTTATSKDGGKLVDPLQEVTLVDKVTYNNLVVGKKYVINGVLMEKTTGLELLINGKNVTSTLEFIAETASGFVNLEFVFNASALKGKEIVVFESLVNEELEIATHKDINDQGQTVRVTKPLLQTEAKYDDGLKETDPNQVATVIDTVSYQDLIIGKKYTVEGILMDKATNKPLLVDGKEIRSTLTFTATQANGTVEIKFDIPAYLLRGKEIVVFEDLIREGQELAFHRDIEDEKQTVIVNNPRIETDATVNGEKIIIGSGAFTIEDLIKYFDLIPGKKYTINGWLVDKATGEPIYVDGEQLIVSLELVPETKDGEVIMTFNLPNGEVFWDTSLVVFQELISEKGDIIVEHQDIDNERQTVTISSPPVTPSGPQLPNTGEKNSIIGLSTAIVLLTIGLSLVLKKQKEE